MKQNLLLIKGFIMSELKKLLPFMMISAMLFCVNAIDVFAAATPSNATQDTAAPGDAGLQENGGTDDPSDTTPSQDAPQDTDDTNF